MKPTPLKDISEELVFFNRERYKNELAQGVYELMRTQNVNRTRLAELLGLPKSAISRCLSGSQNLRAETLADIFLVLGRTPHVLLGTEIEAIRFPVDEGASQKGTVTSSVVDGPYSFEAARSRTSFVRLAPSGGAKTSITTILPSRVEGLAEMAM